MKVLGVSGSLQAASANLALLKTAAAYMPRHVEFEIFDGIRDLPPFNPDTEANGELKSVRRWRLALERSDAVLISAPEYAFGMPGALKNAIDWVIGSGELERKIVAITAAVAWTGRGRHGLDALRNTLTAVSATIVGGEPIPKGPEFESEVAALVRQLLERASRTLPTFHR